MHLDLWAHKEEFEIKEWGKPQVTSSLPKVHFFSKNCSSKYMRKEKRIQQEYRKNAEFFINSWGRFCVPWSTEKFKIDDRNTVTIKRGASHSKESCKTLKKVTKKSKSHIKAKKSRTKRVKIVVKKLKSHIKHFFSE